MQTYINLQETILKLFVEITLHLSKPPRTLACIVDRLPAGEQQGTYFEYFGECLEINSDANIMCCMRAYSRYVSTVRKNGRHVLDAMRDALRGIRSLHPVV